MGREEHKRARLLLESKGSQLFRSIVSIVLLALRVFLFNASICSDVPLLELFFDKGLLLSLESSYKIMLHCRFSLFSDAFSADVSLLES